MFMLQPQILIIILKVFFSLLQAAFFFIEPNILKLKVFCSLFQAVSFLIISRFWYCWRIVLLSNVLASISLPVGLFVAVAHFYPADSRLLSTVKTRPWCSSFLFYLTACWALWCDPLPFPIPSQPCSCLLLLSTPSSNVSIKLWLVLTIDFVTTNYCENRVLRFSSSFF